MEGPQSGATGAGLGRSSARTCGYRLGRSFSSSTPLGTPYPQDPKVMDPRAPPDVLLQNHMGSKFLVTVSPFSFLLHPKSHVSATRGRP